MAVVDADVLSSTDLLRNFPQHETSRETDEMNADDI